MYFTTGQYVLGLVFGIIRKNRITDDNVWILFIRHPKTLIAQNMINFEVFPCVPEIVPSLVRSDIYEASQCGF